MIKELIPNKIYYTGNANPPFYEKRSWYKAAVKTEKRWGSPAYVTLAFIKQESELS